ncbi:MAG: family 88 glycosyl hydrolase [Linnemannia gamsii]|nr:MAG: family 88 glycosyl hydrolase [Linnemannia gamsii]
MLLPSHFISAHSRFAAASCLVLAFALFTLPLALAQTPTPKSDATKAAAAAASVVEQASIGDAPDDPGPLAKDLSPKLESPAIRNAMKKVADWQLRIAEPNFNSQWSFAAFYDGLIAASATTGNPAYRDAVKHYADQQHWTLTDNRFPHADDMALGKSYTELYLAEAAAEQQPNQIANTKANLDRLLTRPYDPANNLWRWCDTLYMVPPILVRMAKITGDHKYIDFMKREWDITVANLYNPTEHLFFRDDRYLKQTESNGKPLFWSRGNGWVVGALVMILQDLPANDPSRPKFIAKLQDMAAALAAIQGPDGLWRSGLLDPASYDLPEISGSAFYTYAMAYGINEHILDHKKYEPVVAKAWAGMLTHIYADGRLGSIQPIGAAPGKFKPSASSVFGVGGFLLAGSELDHLASH